MKRAKQTRALAAGGACVSLAALAWMWMAVPAQHAWAAPDAVASTPAPGTPSPDSVAPATQPSDLPAILGDRLSDLIAAIQAAKEGKTVLAQAMLENLAEDFPQVPELKEMARKVATRARPGAAVQPSRARLGLNDLTDAQRLRVRLLSKRLDALAQQTDESARKAAAAELLSDVKRFALDVPDLPRVWLMQASLCLYLDRPLEGRIAGRNLADLRALESFDPQVQALLAELVRRGWMAKVQEEPANKKE